MDVEEGLSWNLRPRPCSESAGGEEMRQAFLPCMGRRGMFPLKGAGMPAEGTLSRKGAFP